MRLDLGLCLSKSALSLDAQCGKSKIVNIAAGLEDYPGSICLYLSMLENAPLQFCTLPYIVRMLSTVTDLCVHPKPHLMASRCHSVHTILPAQHQPTFRGHYTPISTYTWILYPSLLRCILQQDLVCYMRPHCGILSLISPCAHLILIFQGNMALAQGPRPSNLTDQLYHHSVSSTHHSTTGNTSSPWWK